MPEGLEKGDIFYAIYVWKWFKNMGSLFVVMGKYMKALAESLQHKDLLYLYCTECN